MNPGRSDAQPVLLDARQSDFLGGQEPDVREEAPRNPDTHADGTRLRLAFRGDGAEAQLPGLQKG